MNFYKTKDRLTCITIVAASLMFFGCMQAADQDSTGTLSISEVYQDDFMIGAALNHSQIAEDDVNGVKLVKEQFNTITPENIMKWEIIHPEPDTFDFEAADQFVQFGEQNDMFMVGHTLVWHSQTPEWVFLDEEGNRLEREALLERMQNHIQTVVGRYRGQIHGWDVVNEALEEDGSLRNTPWLEIIGEDYIAKAFEYAHEADP